MSSFRITDPQLEVKNEKCVRRRLNVPIIFEGACQKLTTISWHLWLELASVELGSELVLRFAALNMRPQIISSSNRAFRFPANIQITLFAAYDTLPAAKTLTLARQKHFVNRKVICLAPLLEFLYSNPYL